ncbi:uncharacterized protein LOC127290072 [Leptopilina boulardi]|uniref:uncharacterized protein LOC127290072 n=1 Tax=Leptopilina boulardi TaxID=63433 RepID=UPI0021F61F64|nr:uncharacterized protein LOC127290072 [Leptopilina boulardi]XP_051174417.1 uncharacterized protein LOC127290072 [Leptopilina boulardi]
MLENTIISAQHSTNFQFLSVCHYITTFGIFFYNKDLITLEQRNQTVPVLNTYFEYLNNSQNEYEAKLQLLKKVLKRSDLYGGGENETLDKKYVEETYQYIISTALFSHYGNINGYLAKIINTANDITYSALKKNVFQHLSRNYTTKDYCSPKNDNYKISSLAIKKIFQNNIWSIFPEPEKDTSIMDVDYIYAMVGLKISRSVSSETLNISYHDYILIARELDLQENYTNEIYEMILTFYSTSALFFYAYNEKEIFRENENFQTNEFWMKAYETLFLHINSKMHKLTEEIFANHIHYKLEKEISKLKTRTFIATNILWKYCNYSNYDDVSKFFVALYKTCQWIAKRIVFFKCKRNNLPILENVYEGQFKNIKKIYNQIEVNLISNFLVDNNLVEKLNSNVTIISASVLYKPYRCYNCLNIKQKLNNDIYVLFQIEENNKKEFYAIKQEKTGMTLLVNSGNERNFSKAITNLISFPIDNGEYSTILKKANEDYKVFIKRLADIKTTEFVTSLIENYRNETAGEHIIHFAKSLIPFYSCIESIKENDDEGATISCMLDVLSLIPIAGVTAKYGEKITSSLVSSLSKKYLIIPSFAKTGVKTLMQISKIAARTVAEEILTKSFLKDLSVATLRTIDPGFELTFQLSRFGIRTISNSYRFASKIFLNPSIIKSFQSLESIVKSLENIKLPTYKGLVPKILHEENNYQVVRFYYPGGENTFGPTCLSSFGTTAELRTIEGNPFQVPVIPIIDDVNKISPRQFSPKTGKISYRQFSPESGKISTVKLEMTRNDLLRKIMPYLNLDTDVKITRNYQVYHNTIEWHETPKKKIKPEGNEEQNSQIAVIPDTSLESVPSDNIPKIISGSQHNLPEKPTDEISKKLMPSKTIEIVGLPSDNIPSTSKGFGKINSHGYIISGTRIEKPIPTKNQQTQKSKNSETNQIFASDSKSYSNFFGEEMNNLFARTIQDFKERGFSIAEDDIFLMAGVRRIIEMISNLQSMDTAIKLPAELWLSTKTTLTHVKILENLKGKDFYFNDLTFLTDIPPIVNQKIVPKKTSTIVLKPEIRYHIKINSQYGFVDLPEFHNSFTNQYIVFPEIEFTVENTHYINGKSILQLDLIQKPMTKEKWLKIREQNSMLLGKEELIKNERSKSIENAAYSISTRTPLHRFIESKKLLKKYILKTHETNSDLTYNSLAQDIFGGGSIPEKYDEFEIKNHIFIDDVLFEKSLNKIDNLELAKKRINEIFDGIYEQNVEPVFNKYLETAAIHDNMRFEDYYIIYSRFSHTLPLDINTQRRLVSSLYRLALRQCDEELVKIPNTLYYARNVPLEDFNKIAAIKKDEYIEFLSGHPFNSNRQNVIEEQSITTSTDKLVLYQLEIKNPAGIAYIEPINENANKQYYISCAVEIKKDRMIATNIDGKDVFVLKIYDDPQTKEIRMVELVDSLNELYSTDTKFYVNDI